MKDFHNVFAYYGRSKPKEVNVKETTFFYFTWCDVKKNKKNKIYKWKYQEMSEMILIFMKFIVSTKHCDYISLE